MHTIERRSRRTSTRGTSLFSIAYPDQTYIHSKTNMPLSRIAHLDGVMDSHIHSTILPEAYAAQDPTTRGLAKAQQVNQCQQNKSDM